MRLFVPSARDKSPLYVPLLLKTHYNGKEQINFMINIPIQSVLLVRINLNI